MRRFSTAIRASSSTSLVLVARRLFDEDVLAGVQNFSGKIEMSRGRRRDDDGVDLRIVQSNVDGVDGASAWEIRFHKGPPLGA